MNKYATCDTLTGDTRKKRRVFFWVSCSFGYFYSRQFSSYLCVTALYTVRSRCSRLCWVRFSIKNSIFDSLEIHICIELRWVRAGARLRWFIISRIHILPYFRFYVSGLRMKYISEHCFAGGQIVVDIVEMEIWHRCCNWSREKHLAKKKY